jgi:hypothetical protein
MLDPEAFVLAGGKIALTTLMIFRLVLLECDSLRLSLRKWRKRK